MSSKENFDSVQIRRVQQIRSMRQKIEAYKVERESLETKNPQLLLLKHVTENEPDYIDLFGREVVSRYRMLAEVIELCETNCLDWERHYLADYGKQFDAD